MFFCWSLVCVVVLSHFVLLAVFILWWTDTISNWIAEGKCACGVRMQRKYLYHVERVWATLSSVRFIPEVPNIWFQTLRRATRYIWGGHEMINEGRKPKFKFIFWIFLSSLLWKKPSNNSDIWNRALCFNKIMCIYVKIFIWKVSAAVRSVQRG